MKRLILAILLFPISLSAQAWSGVLAPSRAVDWSGAGVTGGIPNYTTVYQTLSPAVFPNSNWWLPASGSSVGTQITTTILGAWSTPNTFCPAGSWGVFNGLGNSVTSSVNIKVGASQGAMGADVVANGTTYPNGTTTQSIAVANAANEQYVQCFMTTRSNPVLTLTAYFTPGWTPGSGGVQDLIRLDDAGGHFAIAQLAGGSGSGYCIRAHAFSGVTTSACSAVLTQNHRYLVTVQLNSTTNRMSVEVQDPSNNFSVVGSVMTLIGGVDFMGTYSAPGTIYIGNVENGMDSNGTINYFEDIQVQNTTTTFPGSPTGYTAAGIASVLSACPSQEVVKLAAGTFNLSDSIAWTTSCVLRGAGADQTFLVYSGASGNCGTLPLLCMQESGFNSGGSPQNGPVNVTGTLTKGSTTITLATVPNLKVGNPILIDQCPAGTSGPNCATGTVTDTGTQLETDLTTAGTGVAPGISGPYSNQGNSGNGLRTGRQQVQVVTVTGCGGVTTPGASCTGTNVSTTISPGLYDTDWSTSNSIQAWWASNPSTGAGVEDLSIDARGFLTNGVVGIGIHNGINDWVKGVRVLDPQYNHVFAEYSKNISVRNSYFYLTQNWTVGSYGVSCFSTSDMLIENNIFQAVASPVIRDACEGEVVGYNYNNLNFVQSAGSNFNMIGDHGSGTNYNLDEGNVGNQHLGDTIHGTHNLNTDFRNYFTGPSQACWQSSSNTSTSVTALATGTFSACTSLLSAIELKSFTRFHNVIGNVLGTTGVNTTYDTTGSAPVYALGQGFVNSGVTVPNDANVSSTLMRWGNCDAFHGFSAANCQFNSGEVPSALSGVQSGFSNSVPASHTLPASFYYGSRPSWLAGTYAWPLTGPDIILGNQTGTGGLASTIPAQDCYTNVMMGPANGVGTPLSFNENNCPYTGSLPQAATPSCTPGSGIYGSPQSVTCTDASAGSVICYRTDGGIPATNGTTGCVAPATKYTTAITVSASGPLIAIAGGTGYTDSSTASYTYTITNIQNAPPNALFLSMNLTCNCTLAKQTWNCTCK